MKEHLERLERTLAPFAVPLHRESAVVCKQVQMLQVVFTDLLEELTN